MAITHIHAITGTPNKALDYAINDKTGKLKDNISDSIEYAIRDKTGDAVYYTLSTYQRCMGNTAKEVFHSYAEQGRGKFSRKPTQHKSGNEVLMWHLVQSFDEDIPPHVANEIGHKLASEIFKDHACVISTHTNTDNIHNHIMICAWDRDGHKWNNDNANYRRIRKVSDRLCEEYGLNVLYNTQNERLIKYTGSDGKIHYYEPTQRKNELIKKRERGEISTDDVGSIRNTPSYEQAIERDFSNRDIIKSDIDNLLPIVKSYDELLDRLRDLGYTVNDKKKNGEWLKHVSFQAPSQEKATRDNRIGDNEFYSRENLTAYIEEQVIASQAAEKSPHREDFLPDLPVASDVPMIDSYGTADVQAMNEDFKRAARDDTYIVVRRSEPERSVIKDIKRCDLEVKGLIDTSGIYRIIKEQEAAAKSRRQYAAHRREEQLIQRIREGFENLRFMERQGIHSYDHLNTLYKAVYDSYNNSLTQLAQAEQLVSHFIDILTIPEKAAVLEQRIAAGRGDDEYLFESYGNDTLQLEQYHKTMEQYKIAGFAGVQALHDKVSKVNQRIASLKALLNTYSINISEYERCMRVLSRIDHEINRDNGAAASVFENIKMSSEAAAKNTGDRRARHTRDVNR